MSLLVLWLVVFALIVIKYNHRTILYIPVLTILVKVSTQLIAFTGYYRSIILIDYSIILFVILISTIELYKNKRIRLGNKSLNKRIFLFISLIILLIIINSSDPFISIKRSLGITASLVLFIAITGKPISRRDYHYAIKQLIIFLLIFSINSLFLSLLKIGPSINEMADYMGYSESFIKLGSFSFFELHGVAIIAALILFFRQFNRGYLWKSVAIITSVIVIVILFFMYKRAYLAIIIGGIIVYYYSSIVKSKKIYRAMFFSLISLTILYFSFKGFFMTFMEARSDKNTIESVKNSGRMLEFMLYPQVLLHQKNQVLFFLFGDESFNTVGKFKQLNQIINLGKDRSLHNDFSHLLYGTGIVGLSLYLSIIITIVRKSLKNLKDIDIEIKEYGVGAMIVIATIIISSFGDGILSFENRVVPYFAIGLFLSVAKSKKQKIYE